MQNITLDIREMSDSKELYERRPNPFIAIFTYCLILLLIAAVVYSVFGKIDIVTTAYGVIGSGDDVCAVSCMMNGKIKEIHGTDGQFVKAGEPLFVLDTSELELSLGELQRSYGEYDFKLTMINRFIAGIETGENPFSSDFESAEYPYYIQYQNYALSLYETLSYQNYEIAKAQAELNKVKQLSALLGERDNIQTALNDLNVKILQHETQIGYGTIVSEKDGYLSTPYQWKTGAMISVGTLMASVIPEQGEEFKVQIYVNNNDIANIKVGSTVRYTVSSLPSRKFGTLAGTVKSISTDSVLQDEQYTGVFLVESSIPNVPMSDDKGNTSTIGIGMQVECKIITRRITIWEYLLEKIGI